MQSFICINLKKAKQSNILNMLICDKIIFVSNGMINTKFMIMIMSGEGRGETEREEGREEE